MSQPVSDHCLCQSQNIQAYFDHELDPAMHKLVERHIHECPVCDSELGALQRLQALIGLAFRSRSVFTPALYWR